jgi:hypothetical protein
MFSDERRKNSNSKDNNSEYAAKCAEGWNKKRSRAGTKKRRSYFDKADESNNPDIKKRKKSTVNEPQDDHEASSCHGSSIPHCPWGGKVGDVYLKTTCTIDNLLFLMHRLIISRNDVLQWLETSTESVAKTLITVSELFAKGDSGLLANCAGSHHMSNWAP